MVDSYNTELIKMSAAISERRGGIDRIGFKSLVDMFDLGDLSADIPQIPGLPELERHIPTERTAAAEISRRMLLRIGRPEDKILRSRIISGDHGALKLYRGFSRFMAEDLSLNQHTRHLSRCKLKKLATKVAFEMIQRNEAYSNLVELFFPHHVRLSIHAHDNAGPKFGIKLLGPNVRAVEELSFVGAEMRSVDLLHVPTPWHNCLVEVRGHSTLIMTKSKVVRAALSDGSFSGGWVDVGDEDQSGHFRLQPAAFVKQCDEERDSPDMLDCCDAENPYLGGRGAVLDADMPYLYADMGFLYASLSGVFLH